MLPALNRMRRSVDFAAALRGGRVGGPRLVVHRAAGDEPAMGQDVPRPALVGLAVSRAVGNSVVRHRVSRRVRAQLTARIETMPAGSRTVVRALPPSASATSAELGRDLDRALLRLASR